jgi:Porin subfamily
MTLMKSILLGSAAGIVAVAAAQAADLPTKKAAPAEYVKICNVGGMAGFVLPGSDTCFKISGYITGQVEAGNLKDGFSWAPGPGGVGTTSVLVAPGNLQFNRPGFGWTTRLNFSGDARSDTSYGVLRGYFDAQWENGNGFDNTGTGAYINHAYVQWAGITAGKANSFFSFFGGGEAWANIFSPDQQGFNQPDLLAYTATFGGGFSATLAAQSAGTNGFSGGGTDSAIGFNSVYGGGANNGGGRWPDIVGVLRVDQGWGSAQISGVAHEVLMNDAAGLVFPGTNTVAGDSEHTWGWGVLGGVKFNVPSFGPGDNFQLQGVYTQNAFWYSGIPDGMWGENGQVNGNGISMAAADAWSNGDGSFASPHAWSIEGFYEHHIGPTWTLALEGAFAEVNWNGLATNIPGSVGGVATGAFGTAIPERAQSWIVGGVAHWDPVVNLDFEFELLYQSTIQSTPLGAALVAPVGTFPTSSTGFAGRFEVTRNF